MQKLLPVLVVFILVAGGFAQSKKTLLAIFPHPDDEAAVADVLVKYAELGYKVQLMIVTDGKDGTRVTDVPAGDELGKLRKEETRCAAKKLGIEEPIFLGIERLDTKIGVRNYFNAHKQLIAELKKRIPEISPSVIITFGPDGDTTHSEHIVVGSAVSDVLLREGWVNKYPLFFAAWKKDEEDTGLGYVNDQYLNVKIEFSQQIEDKALSIMPCYVTQFTPEEMKAQQEERKADKANTAYFRQFAVKKGIKKGF